MKKLSKLLRKNAPLLVLASINGILVLVRNYCQSSNITEELPLWLVGVLVVLSLGVVGSVVVMIEGVKE